MRGKHLPGDGTYGPVLPARRALCGFDRRRLHATGRYVRREWFFVLFDFLPAPDGSVLPAEWHLRSENSSGLLSGRGHLSR